MALKNQNQRYVNGLNPLAYVGVNAYQPSEFVTNTRPPTATDTNFLLGTEWLDIATDTPPTAADIWQLVSLVNNTATWVNFGSSGGIMTLTGDTGGAVSPTAGNINTFGTAGKITVTGNPGISTLTWDLDGSIAQSFPTDNGTAIPAAGILNIITSQATNAAGITTLFSGSSNTVQFNNTDANGNVAFGKSSGKSGLSGSRNSAYGQGSLGSITSGSDNTALGFGALNALTSSSDNTALGSAALLNITTGSNNIAIGFDSGDSYTTNESNNIIIGNTGIIADNATTRIGTHGTQTSAFISGINGVDVDSTTATVVTMATDSSDDQLGTAVITAGSGITVTPTANTITINATIVSGTQGFYAYIPSDVTTFGSIGAFETIPFSATLFNNGSNFDTTTYTYTAPATGTYLFSIKAAAGGGTITSGTTEWTVQLSVSGTSARNYILTNINAYAVQAIIGSGSDSLGIDSTIMVPMTAGDTALAQLLLGPTGASTVTLTADRNYFWGYRVS